MIRIDVADQQTAMAIDRRQLCRAVRLVLCDEAIAEGRISLAIVDDPTIRRLHRQYLGQDEATDVLSFTLERFAAALEGEVIASAETARRAARRFGWSPADELLLYVIHGTLHLVGQGDDSPAARARMRARERHYLAQFGLAPRYRQQRQPGPGSAKRPSPNRRS